ncbi:hypothetical protein C8J57DRAFT_1520864 [Mycena rebaudengoi]|nr:hypothetical protein C8J57DRAFT_1520864 [Mycena rebaudengoi]
MADLQITWLAGPSTPGNPAIPRVMANRSPDRLNPSLPLGKTLGNLTPFPAKSNPRNDRFFMGRPTSLASVTQASINNFGYNAGGWRVEKHPRFVASLTADKRGDIVGFGNDGVYIAIYNGNGTFQPIRRVIDNFGYNQGWRVEKHPRGGWTLEKTVRYVVNL